MTKDIRILGHRLNNDCPYCNGANTCYVSFTFINVVRGIVDTIVVVVAFILDFAGLGFLIRPLRCPVKRKCKECDAVFWLRDNKGKNLSECPRCNYNLTGNVTGNCPECGWKLTQTVERHIKENPPWI